MICRSESGGYWYAHVHKSSSRFINLGPWMHCVMDDFGTLVFTGREVHQWQ